MYMSIFILLVIKATVDLSQNKVIRQFRKMIQTKNNTHIDCVNVNATPWFDVQ